MKPAKQSRWQSSTRAKHTAFSLVELLVVIAVIAILAALLLPVINNAKIRSAEATDFNNLHQIMMAVHVYTDDNQDIIPWSNWDYGRAMPDGTIRPGWLYQFNPATNGPAAFNPQGSVLWDSLRGGNGTKVFLCPIDQPALPGYSQYYNAVTNRPQEISSYVMNGAVNGFQTGYLSNAIPVKASQMRPTDCILFEADGREPFCFNDGANWPPEGLTVRHFDGGTQGFLDGSSGYIRADAWDNELNDPNKNSLWCYPPTDDGGDIDTGHQLFNWSP